MQSAKRHRKMHNVEIPDDLKALVCSYLPLEEIHKVYLSKNWAHVVRRPTTPAVNLWRVLDMDLIARDLGDRVDAFIRYVSQSHGNQIETIRLHKTQASEYSLIALAQHCQNVETVELCFSKSVTDAVVSAFCAHAKCLRVFRATQCPQITDMSLIHLKRHAKSLTNVAFGHCRQLSSKGVAEIVAHAHGLVEVHFQGCPKVDNDALIAIALACPLVKQLHLGGGGELLNSGILYAAQHCHELEVLDISSSNPIRGNVVVSDESVIELLEKCVKLRSLFMSGYAKLSPAVLRALQTYNTKLETLDLGGCRGITRYADFLGHSLGALTHLRELSLWSCKTVTDETVLALAEGCRELVHVDLDGCTVSTSSVQYLKEQCAVRQTFLNGLDHIQSRHL